MVKTCTKCKEAKPYSEFNKNKATKDGYQNQCKSCRREYYEANKDEIKQQRKEYYKANKDKIKTYEKAYREANKEKIKAQRKTYREANKDKIRANNKAWRKANKDYYEAYKKAYNKANKDKLKSRYEANKDKLNAYHKQRRKTDPLYKLKWNLRTRTSIAFRNKGYSKNTKTQKMLGVGWEIAKAHIERQFKKGMSWNNYGDWHVDHIIPLASANTEERLNKLCHYTNLQPLWAEDNISKKDSVNGQQTMLRI